MPRHTVLVLYALYALTGCYAPAEQESATTSAPISYEGYTESDRYCTSGQLYMLVDDVMGDEWKLTGFYESEPLDGRRYRATSRIEGKLTDGLLVLDSRGLLESDPLPRGFTWCMGQTQLRPEDGDPRKLTGQFRSRECGCTMQVSLTGQ